MGKSSAFGWAMMAATVLMTPVVAIAGMPGDPAGGSITAPVLLAQAEPAIEEGAAPDELLLRKKKRGEAAEPANGGAGEAIAPAQAAPAEEPAAVIEEPVKKRRKDAAETAPVNAPQSAPADPEVAVEAPVKKPRKIVEQPAEQPVVADPGIAEGAVAEPQSVEPAAEAVPPKRKKVVPAEQPAETATEPTIEPAVDEALIGDAQAVLNAGNDLASLSEVELRELAGRAARLSRERSLPADLRRQLRALVGDISQAVTARQDTQPAEPQAVPQDQPASADTNPGGGPPAEDTALAARAEAVLNRGRTVRSMAEPDLRELLADTRALIRSKALPVRYREPLQALFITTREEIGQRQAETDTTPEVKPDDKAATEQAEKPAETAPPAEGGENKAVETPVVVPEAEKKAIAFLGAVTPVQTLDDKALRGRLETMRDMLEAGDLSRETERRLREQLKQDRETLRLRIAEAEKAQAEKSAADQAATKPAIKPADKAADATVAPDDKVEKPRRKPKPDTDVVIEDPFETLFKPRLVIVPPKREERPLIIADRRPSARLDDDELVRRIQVYRDILVDERIDPDQRADLEDAIRRDRRELRRRLREDRDSRAVVLSEPTIIRQYSIRLDAGRPSAPRPPSIFVAEEDDSVVEQQLIAPPRRPIRDRVTREELASRPEVIMAEPEVRRAVPGVEIDTVTFGFNESFVREEEIAALDRVGRILEKILAARPDEVFIIEGHTDAVGSDAYNLALSRKRAEAVKEALLEYYVIDEKNLATVGLGERYLKIPTPDPEEENRRVTIRRITDLVRN